MNERPYWWDTVPEWTSPSPAIRHPDFVNRAWDVAVIGAGYTGLAAARHLARSGASVIVFERGAVGSGASSRNGGQVLAGMKLDPATLVARFGEARARQLFDLSLQAIDDLERLIADESIACDYQRTGHLQAASKPQHFDAFREEQALLARVFRHRVELVSKSQQHSELGSPAYHGVMIDERSGALNPARYVDGLSKAACRAGAAIVPGTAVHRTMRDGRAWRIDTSAGPCRARDILAATNGYTDDAAPALRRRFVPIGSYIIATAPLAPADAASILPRRRMAFDSKHFLFYFRLSADNRLLFGGRAEFSTPAPDSTARAAAILERGMTRVFPQLAAARVDYAWSGNVAFTRDEMPRAGLLDGAYYAGGYCGHGIAMATHLGTIVARRIAGEPLDHPLMDDACPPIPFYRGRPWFLPIVGAYYKMKDWWQ